ncbi:1632_t:CDS:2 [Dentiscutata erythropus]|uniref:1632_t:CDS:1 n=1 Tax=Dentiscutata erythropus TaxID=1348616 RepID=A0A9N9BGP5_9GLOM|nr:1632_t:CDS:2 [Dentiscutata erythropus]
MEGMIDTAIVTIQRPFLAFYQKTKGHNIIATRLDYIFVEEQYAQCCKKTCTRFGNSDHLLVESELTFGKNISRSGQRCWDLFKNKLQSILKTTRTPQGSKNIIRRLNKKITRLENKIAEDQNLLDLQLVVKKLKGKLQDELTELANKWQIWSKAKWIESAARGVINLDSENWPWRLKEIKLTGVLGIEFKIQKNWMNIKWVDNKRKNIFWRLQHGALLLEYRLLHIIQNDNGECLECPEELQTLTHFSLNCKTAQMARWGGNPIPQPILPHVVNNRINKKIKTLSAKMGMLDYATYKSMSVDTIDEHN